MRTGPALRRTATLAVPVAVPSTMAAVFSVLRRRLPPRAAHAAGFAVYWLGWCGAFPLWVLGPRGAVRALRSGRRPGPLDVALLAVPVAGAVSAELWPHRHLVDREVAAVVVTTATVNAVGEELLWRGTFLGVVRDDVVRGALWPPAGFTLWHLAPQLVHPSARGRLPFLAAAGVVGAVSTAVAWRTGGPRGVVLPHLLTDACGVRAARVRLGR
ncbi:type II CAAX prenyl endopeptidase Rce1 family protein [Geodermatophilus sp. SYSU D01062]